MMNVVDVQCCGYYNDFLMNVLNIVIALIVQRRRFGANILMSVFAIMNVFNPQHCVFYDDFPMNVFDIMNALMVQRRRCCSFDSPGLARNEPTLGKRSQGDSTPSVLSFFYKGTLTMKHFMANYVEKAQHLWRWSTQTIH